MQMNQAVCPGEGFRSMMEFFETKYAPVLNELRDEGMIQDYGVLTHPLEDEYNFSFYIIYDDERASLDASIAIRARMNERHKGWEDEASNYCTMHKNNAYTHHHWSE